MKVTGPVGSLGGIPTAVPAMGEFGAPAASRSPASTPTPGTAKVVASVSVGTTPYGVAYDAGRGEVFVTNGGSNDVSVISDRTNKIVATVSVGATPSAATYDPVKGEVFVANYNSNTVSVIRDSTKSVVATVAVGSQPNGLCYDRARGEVFVADSGSGNVSVIDDSTNRTVASVTVGNAPNGLAYDSGKGEVWVTNRASNNVSVINDLTNRVVKYIGVGSAPPGAAYDAATGTVLVTNSGSSNVSVLSDTTDSVLATVPVGAYPYGVTVDVTHGEVFVANSNSNNVSVFRAANLARLPAVNVGHQPSRLAYDSGRGEVFVGNEQSDTVSVISDHALTVVSRSYSGTLYVNALVSVKTVVLLDLARVNGSQFLVLYNAATNSSRTIVSNVPGGSSAFIGGITVAAGAFFLAWSNGSTSSESWQEIRTSGAISNLTLPVARSIPWSFPYGNATRLFLSALGQLVELDASSLKLVANFSSLLPSNLSVSTVLPEGGRLYLAGGQLLPKGGGVPFFGYINLTSATLVTVSNPPRSSSSSLYGSFYALGVHGGDLYAGGVVQSTALTTVQGLLYRFVPSPASYRNMSSLLPVRTWGVWAIAPWSKTVGFSLAGYASGGFSAAGSGLYTLGPGPRLVNETGLLPGGFLIAAYLETSSSGGYYVVGGFNTATGLAEVVAVKP